MGRWRPERNATWNVVGVIFAFFVAQVAIFRYVVALTCAQESRGSCSESCDTVSLLEGLGWFDASLAAASAASFPRRSQIHSCASE